MNEIVTISDRSTVLQASRTGAEWTSWTVEGLQLLWQGDDTFWPRTAPVLFPVVGWCKGGVITVAGQSYPMGPHGFASHSLFDVAACSNNAVTFQLRDTPQTRRHFPFGFGLSVTYRVRNRSVTAIFDIANPGDGPMPYALGFHPGFRWPDRATDTTATAVFSAEEQAHVPAITADGLFSSIRRPIRLDGRTLELSDSNLGSEALCFLNARSKSITFRPTRRPAIAVENECFPHFAIWTLPDAPFLSIESWSGHGDPEDFTGEIFDKPSMRILKPGAQARHRVRFSVGEPSHG